MSQQDIPRIPPTGRKLLDDPRYNKGTAFSRTERLQYRLLGLLPPHVETLDEQVRRSREAYDDKRTDLGRHIFLRRQQETNEILFYRMLLDNLTEMMPIIYTPTVGQACKEYSHIYRHTDGLFISYPERDSMDEILDNAQAGDVRVIVVTDGERILGLGDQGAGGMGIPLGKLTLYTACGGVDPAHTLPILLDVGTDNQELLDDPLYVGWRHERIRGQAYFDFVDRFVSAVKRKYPNALLQWEDFARSNAHPLLERYRDRICSFNDDIQGTAAVVLGPALAAMRIRGSRLKDQRVAIMGAGSAGCGIAQQLMHAMMQQGLSEEAASGRFYLIDKPGLLVDDWRT